MPNNKKQRKSPKTTRPKRQQSPVKVPANQPLISGFLMPHVPHARRQEDPVDSRPPKKKRKNDDGQSTDNNLSRTPSIRRRKKPAVNEYPTQTQNYYEILANANPSSTDVVVISDEEGSGVDLSTINATDEILLTEDDWLAYGTYDISDQDLSSLESGGFVA